LAGRAFGADALFTSLDAEFTRVGLANASSTPADRFLDAQSIGSGFVAELIEPCASGLAGRGLSALSGLTALLPSYWGSRRPVAVAGGNARLVSALLAASGADVRLRTRVSRVSPTPAGGYRLLLAPSADDTDAAGPEVADFDAVLVAAPLHGQAGLLPDVPAATAEGKDADYAAAHVTHFASRVPVPEHVAARLARLAEVRPPRGENREYVFAPPPAQVPLPPRGFVALSTTAGAADGQAVHRVVSREALGDDDVLALLGLAAGEDNRGFVDWVQRAAWPAGFAGLRGRGPEAEEEGGRGGGGQVEMAEGLYYLSGGEGRVGTMEMACRMGLNAAGLVARRWTPAAGEESGKDEL